MVRRWRVALAIALFALAASSATWAVPGGALDGAAAAGVAELRANGATHPVRLDVLDWAAAVVDLGSNIWLAVEASMAALAVLRGSALRIPWLATAFAATWVADGLRRLGGGPDLTMLAGGLVILGALLGALAIWLWRHGTLEPRAAASLGVAASALAAAGGVLDLVGYPFSLSAGLRMVMVPATLVAAGVAWFLWGGRRAALAAGLLRAATGALAVAFILMGVGAVVRAALPRPPSSDGFLAADIQRDAFTDAVAEWMFLVNLFMGVVGLALAWVLLQERTPTPRGRARLGPWIGVVMAYILVSSFFGLTREWSFWDLRQGVDFFTAVWREGWAGADLVFAFGTGAVGGLVVLGTRWAWTNMRPIQACVAGLGLAAASVPLNWLVYAASFQALPGAGRALPSNRSFVDFGEAMEFTWDWGAPGLWTMAALAAAGALMPLVRPGSGSVLPSPSQPPAAVARTGRGPRADGARSGRARRPVKDVRPDT